MSDNPAPQSSSFSDPGMDDDVLMNQESKDNKNEPDSWISIYMKMVEEDSEQNSDDSPMNLPDTGTDPMSMLKGDGGEESMDNYDQVASSSNASQAAPEAASSGELAEVAQLAVML